MMTKLVARISRVLSPEHFIVGGVFTWPGQALLTPALLLTRYLLHLTSAYTAWQFRLTFTFSNPTPLSVCLIGYIVDASLVDKNHRIAVRKGWGVQSIVEWRQWHQSSEDRVRWREWGHVCMFIDTYIPQLGELRETASAASVVWNQWMYLNVNPIIDMLSSEECALCSPQPTASLTCLPEPGQCIHIQILDAGAATVRMGWLPGQGSPRK